MRIAVVANSRSGSQDRAHRVADALRDAGTQVVPVPFDELCAPGGVGATDARLTAEEAVDRVVVAGGDGSVGLAAALARDLRVPLAVVPAGTANDFARALGLPLDVDEAIALAADGAAATRTAELAEVAGRPFVNAASAGLAVIAARHAVALKRRLGRFAYGAGALRAGATGRSLRLAVRCDGEEVFRGRAWQIVVAATGAFGGGSGTGGVDPEDLRLDVAVVPAGPRVALAHRALAMRRRRLVELDDVPHHRAAVVELETRAGTGFTVDGEVLHPRPARFAVVGAFEVVVPG